MLGKDRRREGTVVSRKRQIEGVKSDLAGITSLLLAKKGRIKEAGEISAERFAVFLLGQ